MARRKKEQETEKQTRRLTNLDEFPKSEKKIFSFSRDGQKYDLEYTPLTYGRVEAIRAEMLPPRPPTRPISGLDAKTIILRNKMGLPTHEPDEDDPKYRAGLIRYNNDFKLEQVRQALGWEVSKEEFETKIRDALRPGELQGLMDEVDGNAWNVSSALVDDFFGNLNQLTEEDIDSETSTTS